MSEFLPYDAESLDSNPELSLEIDRCTFARCGNPIYMGEKNWVYDEETFCSAVCLARYIGAVKRYARRDY